tara:strand:+ start:993 stop:1190 length:198 start_codon:yes stop_codon:yes gene_type:complete
MVVGLLTEKQKDELIGLEFASDSFFNPIQDLNDNWIISLEEIEQTELEWVKELPLIDFEPKENKL